MAKMKMKAPSVAMKAPKGPKGMANAMAGAGPAAPPAFKKGGLVKGKKGKK